MRHLIIFKVAANVVMFVIVVSLFSCNLKTEPKAEQQPDSIQQPAQPTKSPYVIYDIPDGNYQNGSIKKLTVQNRAAALIVPNDPIDKKKRWVWVAPLSLVLANPQDPNQISYRFYVEALLEAGFHIGGVDVGISCGSPKGVAVCQAFYEQVTEQYHLHPKTRFIAQSNGGLIVYAWAYRHPECVDRVFGIYPVTDMQTWPRLNFVVGPSSFPEPELAYGLSLPELTARVDEYNPISNLKPLTSADVKIFHIHGDRDTDNAVPWDRNTLDFVYQYRRLGGQADYEIYYGRGHGASGEGAVGTEVTYMDQIFYRSLRGLEFLLED